MAEKFLLPAIGLANAHRHWRNRIVTALIWPDDSAITTNDNGVLDILPYSEPGEMGSSIWFEIIREDGDNTRVNGSFLALVRFDEEKEIQDA